jgi:hypothetical protein
MKTYLLLLAACIAGCAGLDITPISPKEEAAAHAGGTGLKGYIIYEPMVVVEVSRKELCPEKDANGNCKSVPIVTCSAGTPFILPDTSKPFLVDVRSGFGKTGVDVTFNNGWELGNIKDNSDNTALLDTINKVIGLAGTRSMAREPPTQNCPAQGLYRVVTEEQGVTLRLLLKY